jgi:uncharacterized protein (TIGR03437 family)
MRFLLLLAGIPFLLCGQIQDLATTGDGGQTYFSTAYRQKGTNQAGYLKIFRVAENGLELFRQLTYEPRYPGSSDSNFYLARRASVSADGRVVAYTASAICVGGSHCIGFAFDQAWFAGIADRSPGFGTLTVSPDGCSFLRYNYQQMVIADPLRIGDVASGIETPLPGYKPIGDAQQSLGNGPVALLDASGLPVLWKTGVSTQLSFAAAPTQARVNSTGERIVYETATTGGNFQLRSYSPASGTDILLATGGPVEGDYQPGSYFHPWLTLDGQFVSYVLGDRLLLQPTDGSAARVLTSLDDGAVIDGVISGFGNLAFAATDAGRLLRIEIASGAKTELVAAVPHLEVTGGAQVPGGRLDVRVTGPAAGDPALEGAGAVAPVVARSAEGVTLQVPWEAAPDSMVRLSSPGNASAFEEVHDLILWWGVPFFYTLPPDQPYEIPWALAAHQDFGATVSSSSPAKPGEVVHLYFTGLGEVSPPIATGAITPAGTLYRLQTPFTCRFHQDAQEFSANILFAGLAPRTVGVEQVDVLVPPQATGPALEIDCESDQKGGTISGYARLPVSP